MDKIGNFLASLFSVNVGRDDQPEALTRIRNNSNQAERDELHAVFTEALANREYDWLTRFDDEEVDALVVTNEEARAFVVEQIWHPLFGPEPVPA